MCSRICQCKIRWLCVLPIDGCFRRSWSVLDKNSRRGKPWPCGGGANTAPADPGRERWSVWQQSVALWEQPILLHHCQVCTVPGCLFPGVVQGIGIDFSRQRLIVLSRLVYKWQCLYSYCSNICQLLSQSLYHIMLWKILILCDFDFESMLVNCSDWNFVHCGKLS